MYSHVETQSKIQNLSSVNSGLEGNVNRLASCYQIAEMRLESETQLLEGLLIGALPSVVTVLSRPIPLPRHRSIRAKARSTLISLTSRTPEIDSTATLIETIQCFELVNTSLKISEEEARKNRVEAADVASRAAVQKAHCASVAKLVEDEQRKTTLALEKAGCDINSAQQKIRENESLHNTMDASANHHDSEADNYGKLVWTSFIPFVNVVTVPVMLIGLSHHSKRRDECRAIQTSCREQISRHRREQQNCESERSRLGVLATQLQSTIAVCSTLESSAETLKEKSKRLTDEYCVLMTDIQRLVSATDMLGSANDDAWDRYRFRTLNCLCVMLKDLKGTRVMGTGIEKLLDLVESVSPKDETDLLEW